MDLFKLYRCISRRLCSHVHAANIVVFSSLLTNAFNSKTVNWVGLVSASGWNTCYEDRAPFIGKKIFNLLPRKGETGVNNKRGDTWKLIQTVVTISFCFSCWFTNITRYHATLSSRDSKQAASSTRITVWDVTFYACLYLPLNKPNVAAFVTYYTPIEKGSSQFHCSIWEWPQRWRR